ncbi:MAG TPA: hypothetical protein VMW16_01335 [Sedimentisphaerales bacterium]|nr:hypothetical protein [Sedimentisphaerales bacterium]
MISVNSNSTCEQARVYYYEYLYGESGESVPLKILAHINQCDTCLAEVDRLKSILAEGKRAARGASTMTNNLRLHFAYTNAFVSCDTVKPFLASLAVPALQIHVPTPITVHLDKCRQCARDLELIRQLDLTNRQMFRLGQLFAEEPSADITVCQKARSVIGSVAAMDFESVSAETLRHICVCPKCRQRLHKERKSIGGSLPSDTERPSIRCDAVSATDIFDYVVPYGVDFGKDAGLRKSLRSHLANCPACLDRMQSLHDTVYGVLERRESGIVTCFKVEEAEVESAASGSESMYADFPIKVRVFDRSGRVAAAAGAHTHFTQVLKQKAAALHLSRLLKPAAAAIFVAGILFLFRGPAAQAMGLAEVYKALERMKNVYIATFYQDESNPTQQIWISRTLNVKLFKAGTQCVLWDLQKESAKSRDLSTDLMETKRLSKDIVASVEQTMKGPVELLPFNNVDEAPQGAEWQAVPAEDAGTVTAGTEVYDLVWLEKRPDGSTVHNKWRGYIDSQTKLPRRIERWERRSEEAKYELVSIRKVGYPSGAEIEAAIKEKGF